MHTRKAITEAIRKLGVQTGDLLMVHASLKAIGPVEGGAETVVAALRSAVGPTGTVMGYASWDRSPYEETLNGARLDDKARRTWPPFDPATAGTYRGFGLLNQFLVQAPGARRRRLGRKSLSFSKSVELHDKVIGHYLNIKHYQ